jgi:hypothetical protein
VQIFSFLRLAEYENRVVWRSAVARSDLDLAPWRRRSNFRYIALQPLTGSNWPTVYHWLASKIIAPASCASITGASYLPSLVPAYARSSAYSFSWPVLVRLFHSVDRYQRF